MRKPKFDSPIIQAIPLSPDDLIEVQVLSSTVPVTLDLEGTCYNEQGDLVSFQQQLTVAAALTLTTIRFRLGYLFLLSAVLHTRTAGIPDGACYCRMTLVKSESGGVFPHRKTLSQGYVSTTGSIGYGSDAIQGPPTDHTFIQSIAIPTPAAGVGMQFVCPNYTELTIILISFLFTTDATAGNRATNIAYSLPPTAPVLFWNQHAHTPSTSRIYNWSPDLISATTMGLISVPSRCPAYILTPGSTLLINSFSIQAGDQFDSGSLLCKRRTIPFN